MSMQTNTFASGSGHRKLGQILLERNEITGEQLIRAIQSQRRVGGRIGTCMLEMEVVTEDGLLSALSDQLGVPAVRIEQLRGIDDDILGLIPSETANRCQAVPFAVGPREVEVATLNVRDLGLLDEIAFCAGRRVRPHIANEARIFEALEKYYGQECPRRYGHLLDRLNRQRYLWEKEHSKPRPLELLAEDDEMPSLRIPDDDLVPPPPLELDDPKLLNLDFPEPKLEETEPKLEESEPELEDRELRQHLGTDYESTAEIRDLMFQDAERMLASETDRDRIGEVLIQILDLVFYRSALFKIRDRQVRGWLTQSSGIDETQFDQLRLPLDQPSIFFNLDQGGQSYLGPVPPMPLHQALASCWGGTLPKACLLVPLRIRGRLVGAFYGDRGDRDLDSIPLQPFLELADKAEKALERCILQRKISARPAERAVVQSLGLQ